MKKSSVAYLGCRDGYTSFSSGSHCIRFKTSDRLERYLAVKKWDHGYLVVDARYSGMGAPVEEYIDLEPILENLYFDAEQFLASIKEVELEHD